MKKIFSLLLAAAFTLSAAACADKSEKLSVPVALDADGNVDMGVALAYETDMETLLAALDEKITDPNAPVSENLNAKTLAVFGYLRESYKTKIFAAQQYMHSKQTEDLVYYTVTGDLPAIKGFDFIFSNLGGERANNEQVDMAIDWHVNSGGLVAMTWHWNVPRDIGKPEGGRAFYADEIENFSYINAVTPGTKEYEIIIRDIDTVAAQLQRMEKAGVPVLFRPLHEAGGRWFWWGRISRETVEYECYQKLWYTIFDRLENYHKLTNLIWVWNGQDKYMTVHPNTYDIAGIDVYPNRENHSALVSDWEKLSKITYGGKMLALTECGYIPDPGEVFGSDAKWLYYMPWYGDFVYAPSSPGGTAITDINGTPSVNPDRMSEEFLKSAFADERVVTWKKLPDYKNTSRELPEHIKAWQMWNDLVNG
ncbi:MAG: glycoside hydrolase family 26 protein [Oscillospiraceae bacterium]|jgi:mannan endo-1,4-beta-mannosidase|nr:glycoside hydrolase family 26 protein [Oscillospiraceae bacterium]